MTQRLNYGYLLLVITVAVLPTALALGWFQITQDPNLRPLGITKQALRAYGEAGAGVEIVALVDWVPPDTGNFSRAHLTETLTRAFLSKGVEVRVVFRAGGDATRITYVVGKTVLGPYPTARASEGVAAAVEAYRMH